MVVEPEIEMDETDGLNRLPQEWRPKLENVVVLENEHYWQFLKRRVMEIRCLPAEEQLPFNKPKFDYHTT
jgi:hypothetical protein